MLARINLLVTCSTGSLPTMKIGMDRNGEEVETNSTPSIGSLCSELIMFELLTQHLKFALRMCSKQWEVGYHNLCASFGVPSLSDRRLYLNLHVYDV